MTQTLTETDVRALLDDPSPAARGRTAEKIAAQYGGGTLTAAERRLAEDVIRLMARDAEESVRATLSHSLRDCPALARDIALTLATDVDNVALPMVRYSGVLTDDDLIAIVRAAGTAKRSAIAGRDKVSTVLADALVETGDEEVVAVLVGNEGASISERAWRRVVEEFGDSERVTTPLVGRSSLPVAIAERLVNLVSERLRDELVARHALPPAVVEDIVLQSRERATLGLLSDAGAMSAGELVEHLNRNGRLTSSIVLRALCLGDMEFFELGTASRAGIAPDAARTLIHDAGPLGLPALIDRARLPKEMLTVLRAAVDTAHDIQFDGEERDRERFRRRMLERVLTHMGDPGAALGDDNVDYLLEKLCELQGTPRAA
jgi:uncharacterized protein (DUF2336 family)